MIFSSLEFIFLFMPVTFAGFLILRHLRSETGIIAWLIGASLLFYGWWNPPYLALILGSVAINYGIHKLILRNKSKPLLTAGVVLNLAGIAYFKYANFFIDSANAIAGSEWAIADIALPLAISFFTFQQIAFLVETYKGEIVETDFMRYVLFVVFFPQLIAGPIVLQRDTVPQFRLSIFSSKLSLNVSIGLTLFAIGLFKKIVIADGMALYASPVFAAADGGASIPMGMAWSAALAYTFQIYFDFSGYCDMALGAARVFGIRLPVNFNSPYKADNIVDFWRRWHITLSHFLRDYLYIPLGGNKKGKVSRYANLIITMILGGLWHGASWTFVFWGFLHGLYLMINHAWKAFRGKRETAPSVVERWAARGVTMLAVIIAWVFFRAETFGGAASILAGMSGLSAADATALPETLAALEAGVLESFVWFPILFAFVWGLPNSIEITSGYRPALDFRKTLRLESVTAWKKVHALLRWRPSLAWSGSMACVALFSVVQIYRLGDLSEFIYFNS